MSGVRRIEFFVKASGLAWQGTTVTERRRGNGAAKSDTPALDAGWPWGAGPVLPWRD